MLSYATSHQAGSRQTDGFFKSSQLTNILGLLAAGEIIVDKLPGTPNRTAPLGLGARIICGAIVGGSICAAQKKSVWTGAAIGVFSAVAAAYAGQRIRQAIADKTGIPSSLLGAAEDLIAIEIGAKSLKIIN